MVSDQEIAKGVETVLRQSDPNSVTSYGVVSQLEAKLGLDLSHKTAFINEQINLLLRSHPTSTAPPPPPPPQPTPTATAFRLQQKDPFALHHHLPPSQYQQFPSHFALHPQHHHFQYLLQQQQQQQQHVFRQDLNFGQPQPPPPPPQRQLQQVVPKPAPQNTASATPTPSKGR